MDWELILGPSVSFLQKEAPQLPPKALNRTMRQIKLSQVRQAEKITFTQPISEHFALRDQWVHDECQSYHATTCALSCSRDKGHASWQMDTWPGSDIHTNSWNTMSQFCQIPADTISPSSMDGICLRLETFWILLAQTTSFLTTKSSSPLLMFNISILSSWGSKSIQSETSLVLQFFFQRLKFTEPTVCGSLSVSQHKRQVMFSCKWRMLSPGTKGVPRARATRWSQCNSD